MSLAGITGDTLQTDFPLRKRGKVFVPLAGITGGTLQTKFFPSVKGDPYVKEGKSVPLCCHNRWHTANRLSPT